MEAIEADYVVVGAGSSGCVVAARLSEDPSVRVLLLEAGGRDRNIWIHIPLGYGKTIIDASVNWCYETEPDPGVNDRRVYWPRGKVLGGSSSINGLVYIRGQAEDFDHWRQLGNAGWSYADVLPYFRKSENRIGPADPEHHGTAGPLAVSDLSDRHELCEAYIAACRDVGIPRNDDFNGARQEGVGYFQLTAKRGRRSSTAVAFLRPALRRPNLRVETHAHAERVVFSGKRAAAVMFGRNGTRTMARARREVILCGGAVNSPQLLMLSGVGPAEHLAQHGIEVVADLPGVGANLQDHYQTRIAYRCTAPITVNDIFMSRAKMARTGLQYALFGTGALASAAGQVSAFTRTRPELATPDIQFHFIVFSSDRPAQGLHKFSGFTQNVCQLRPESRGTVRLRTADPYAPPAIQPNYLSTRLDRETLVEGLKIGRRIAERAPLARYIAGEYLPGSDVRSDDEWLAYAREYGGTIYHPVGTCRMGQGADAVVDDTLRVRGLEGLRVADGSIMPTLVSGNTNAACIMIGEKAADMVRGVTVSALAA